MTGSIDNLKFFVEYRDNSPLFEDVRGTSRIGFPLIQLEDGTYTRDVNEVLQMLGISTRINFKR